MKTFIAILMAMLSPAFAFSQQEQAVPLESATIIFNGACIVMHDKADLVVQNTSAKALTVKNGGGIISEDAANNVIWKIGNDSGYSVPFVSKDFKPIPVSFSTSNSAGAGSFTMSTYSGSPDWKNSDYLPGTVSNVNRNGKDNSRHLADRFWKISPSGYTANPHLKNLSFSYRDIEWSEDSNVITEKNLVAQNWNGTKWLTYTGKGNPSSNAVKISSLNTFFSWWVLVDSNYALNDASANFAFQNLSEEASKNEQLKNIIGSLGQNFPNPASGVTTINYSLPQHFISARIIVTDKSGNVLKEVIIASDRGSISVNAGTLSSGIYQYSLYVDGRLIDSKQMVITK